MNRKHNPMVALAALILLAVVLVMACTGCTVRASWGEEETEPTPRFTTEYVGSRCTIITDSETGVQYLFYKGHGAGGLTKLGD
jgi:hypothetical protein